MRLFLKLSIVMILLMFIPQNKSLAQTTPNPNPESGSATVTASVGEYFLIVSGYHSPNASVVIQTSTEVFLNSTTADGNGYFTIPNTLITKDLEGFCFLAIDFRRIGESESCVYIEDVITDDKTYSDIFLPPSIGLSRRLITAGEDAEIYGYTMPNAEVKIEFDEEVITMQANEVGYYEYLFEDAEPGVYSFTSRATLSNEDSLDPKTKAVLEVVTVPEKVITDITDTIDDVEDKYPGALFLISLLLILLLLLLGLIWKTKPRFIYAFFDKFKKRYPMHHDYFLFKK